MPQAEDDAYNEALGEARQQFLSRGGPRSEAMQRLYETYARMLVDITEDVQSGAITEERARGLRRSIRGRLSTLADEVGEVVGTGVESSIDLAIQGHVEGVAAAAQTAGTEVSVGTAFTNVPDDVLRYAMVRRGMGGAETFQTLARRNAMAAADDIDDAIVSALGRGESNQRLTRKIAQSLAGDDEQLQAALRSLGSRGGRTLEALQAGVEIDADELKRAKRLLYDARRIATSEINSHYDESDKISAARSPVVDLVEWNVSSRHTIPDVCDVLEQQDLYGYGEGLYHPSTAPALPHPFCMCWTSVVTRPPERYGDEPRPTPDRPSVAPDRVRSLLEGTEGDRKITDKYVENQTNMLDRLVESAHEHERGTA